MKKPFMANYIDQIVNAFLDKLNEDYLITQTEAVLSEDGEPVTTYELQNSLEDVLIEFFESKRKKAAQKNMIEKSDIDSTYLPEAKDVSPTLSVSQMEDYLKKLELHEETY